MSIKYTLNIINSILATFIFLRHRYIYINKNPPIKGRACTVRTGALNEPEIINNKNGDRDFGRVNEYIENQLPEYHEFEYEPELDMLQSHGFADERDYNNWRYGPIATRWR